MNTVKQFSKHSVFVLFALLISITSCNTSRTAKGGAMGAGAGAAIGGLIGSKSDNVAKGAILGAMVGGTAGALIGNYMDEQAEELKRDLEGAKVERIGEGIKITFDSGILFGFDSSVLTQASEENITQLAETLKKYDDTEILIEGYTDSKGTEDYNLKLSKDRAKAVSSMLTQKGVSSGRITEHGYGEAMPVADNSTDEGRALNRRVEIAIYANKKLQRAAERGDIG